LRPETFFYFLFLKKKQDNDIQSVDLRTNTEGKMFLFKEVIFKIETQVLNNHIKTLRTKFDFYKNKKKRKDK
jgi:hypothetical protein